MKKLFFLYKFTGFFLVSVYFSINFCFANCYLTPDAKNISIDDKYNISGIFRCEKIELSDYGCDNNDIYWWNGTKWKKNASVGCDCTSNTECQTGICLKGICSFNISSSIPKINFQSKTISGAKDSIMKNIIIINNPLNKKDIFDITIGYDGTRQAESIYMFSYISGSEFDNDKFAQYEINANTTKKILLLTKPVNENSVGNLTISACSHLTKLCAKDTAQYNITPFDEKFFSAKVSPDIGIIAFVLIAFLCGFLVV